MPAPAPPNPGLPGMTGIGGTPGANPPPPPPNPVNGEIAPNPVTPTGLAGSEVAGVGAGPVGDGANPLPNKDPKPAAGARVFA
jgi:hypothetical protein